MAVQWNADQQQVIDHKDGSLLVSAAAGSGKTAVMIERLAQRILDPADPTDVEELLVVTFTNAAAAQMRDRLYRRLSDALAETEDPVVQGRLLMQIKKLPLAHVMTIHSFCLQVIREYITCIDGLDPGFRIADDTEAALLRADVLADTLEDAYAFCEAHPEETEAQNFMAFVDDYSGARQDQQIEDRIRELHAFLESMADPERWLDEKVEMYAPSGDMQYQETPWFRMMQFHLSRQIAQAGLCFRRLRKLYLDAGCDPSHKVILQIQDILTVLEEAEQEHTVPDADRMRISRMDYKPWKEDPAGRSKAEETAEAARKAVAEILNIREEWMDPEGRRRMHEVIYPDLCGLRWFMKNYRTAYQSAKAERSMVDFSDLEHFALRILYRDGEPSLEARELMERYRYICVDEYQDSNEVQEAVIRSIARKNANGDPINLFMVGDVKQSIYKFREARPDLFLEKMRRYPEQDDADVAYLHQNFRSREAILEAVNDIFYALMYQPDGEIDYTEREALIPGLADPGTEEGVLSGAPELCLLRSETPLRARESLQAEADYVASRIQSLILGGARIFDRKAGNFRPLRYGDIVILLRAGKSLAPVLRETLDRYRVPSYSEITAGFYQTKEIQCMTGLLRILDNPLQDIPLAGVLYSPMFSFTGRDLAKIRKEGGRREYLYDALVQYAASGSDPVLRERTARFLDRLSVWRQEERFLPLHELIWKLMQDTGYYIYISGTPDGQARRANLDLLMDRAIAYEKGSFSGLFHFLRYIEKMEEQSREEVQASIAGEEDNVVRIMSIHKSKGLEFPVVFVCGLGHRMNQMDLSGRILLDPDMGIGAQAMDSEGGFYYETMPHLAIREKKKQEMMAEEMRVLYVALTRAEQKLYLTAYTKDEKETETVPQGEKLSAERIRKASSFLDWLLPIVQGSPHWTVSCWDLEENEPQEEADSPVQTPAEDLEERLAELDNRLLWQYPFAWREQLPSRFSVSQLKKTESGEAEEEMIRISYPDSDDNAGTRAGTAIHKVLSLLNFNRLENAAQQLEEMVRDGLLTAEERELVPERQIENFAASAIAKRMRHSVRLLKEQPFIVQIPIEKIREWVPGWMEALPQAASKERVMVQGIIDSCFLENGAWVIVDYKSDRVLEGKSLSQYTKQLRLYAYAMETITGMPVAEMLLYATRTGQEIRIEGKENNEYET